VPRLLDLDLGAGLIQFRHSLAEVKSGFILKETKTKHSAQIVGYSSRRAWMSVWNAIALGKARTASPTWLSITTVKRLERPKLTEGFDALYHVRLVAEGLFEVADWIEEPDDG
jgi:hypothetical protein